MSLLSRQWHFKVINNILTKKVFSSMNILIGPFVITGLVQEPAGLAWRSFLIYSWLAGGEEDLALKSRPEDVYMRSAPSRPFQAPLARPVLQ
jgi:hypothetical protein